MNELTDAEHELILVAQALSKAMQQLGVSALSWSYAELSDSPSLDVTVRDGELVVEHRVEPAELS